MDVVLTLYIVTGIWYRWNMNTILYLFTLITNTQTKFSTQLYKSKNILFNLSDKYAD